MTTPPNAPSRSLLHEASPRAADGRACVGSLSPEISDFRDDERRLAEPSFELRSRVVASDVAPPAHLFTRPLSLGSLGLAALSCRRSSRRFSRSLLHEASLAGLARPRCASGRPRSSSRPTSVDRSALTYRNTAQSAGRTVLGRRGRRGRRWCFEERIEPDVRDARVLATTDGVTGAIRERAGFGVFQRFRAGT